MEVNVIGHSYITYGARWLMGLTSALQPARTNINYCHQFFNSQAVEILRNDGYENYANIIEFYSKDLDRGVNWADIGWKNITHYFNPDTGKGKLKFANAVDETVWNFNRAVRNWREGSHNRAMFFLGAAAHIVQDLCVPQHAANSISPGHRRYEQWAKKRFSRYTVCCGGNYGRFENPAQFALENARTAAQLRDDVKLSKGSKSFHRATEVVLPMAQLSTAELFHFFLQYVEN
ncbi:MAG: zinc dependent phospholipase C family protein [Clostridia bacterium]|jgi:phospholipase C